MRITNKYIDVLKMTSVDFKYLVLHSTSGPIKRILDTFGNQANKKSCHYIIDEDGEIYQLLKVSKGDTQMGWHAGRSMLKLPDGKIFSEFNKCSVGIELINKNGNVYPYTGKLYQSLIELVQHLIKMFPILKDPSRILGHEHISGFRGKVDPGHMFDWERFYKECYGSVAIPIRKPQMSLEFKNLLIDIQRIADQQGIGQENTDKLMKRLMRYYHEKQEDIISPLLGF